MNMADFFDLPVSAETFGAAKLRTDAATAHAVNCHDDLVAALELAFELHVTNHPQWEKAARAALAKARGED